MARKPTSKTAHKKPGKKASGKAPKASPGDPSLAVPAPDPDPILPGVNPAVEDHASPATGLPFPIAAIGASAGGLEAFNELLGALPAKTGIAFVMIQHLSPSHTSMLSDILARATAIPVTQVENNMPVEPDHIYVIPPGKTMVLSDGVLQLSPRTEIRGQARPIDQFMRSLAEEHGHKAIGVVLSGTGNDGSLGIEEIKAAGGITFAQDNTAEHTGMPRSAIAAGAVDHVLRPGAIAAELARIASHPYLGPAVEEGRINLSPGDLHRVLEQLRARSGVDFSQYKRNTLYRRISRRMLLSKIDRGPEYLALLDHDPAEADALYQDVLINVTSFFRNPDAYEALKAQVFARLTENRGRQDQVRVWALGCSTGEEAYSIAIAFTEFLEATGRRVPLQVFATDLNGAGIERARAGIYGKGIVQDVSPERLRRHFVEIDGSYRISKPIRDMCVFARQNVLADPPFSRLDLVACRNMLIYLEPALQQKLIPLLHYALRPEGYLWLGGSETIGGYRDLFEPLDPKSRIYTKRGTARPAALPAVMPRWTAHLPPKPAGLGRALEPDPQREADRVLLARYAPPAVVLNEDLEIVQFRGDTSPFLRPAPGKASLNLLKMLREGLLVAVRGAIARARREQGLARESGLRVRTDGGWNPVEVVVLPLKPMPDSGGTMLVMFEEPAHSVESRARQMDTDARAALAAVPEGDGSEIEVMRLKQEIGATRDYLQSVIEQQEAANEELQSANEEVQSANEELQSVNEELETSKEEIQSANEELATVNEELQGRNADLSQSNNDLGNLISSVQMAIVMLGPDLRIRRFTPTAEKLLNLIPADVGRPIGDIKLNLSIHNLEEMALEVIETVTPRELEVQARGEHWYSLRVRPYRTAENRIDGAVVVLVDIDNVKKADRAVRESERRFELLADSAPVLIWMNDIEGCRFVNRAFEEFVGVLEADIRSSEPGRFVHPDDRAGYLDAYAEALREHKPFEARLRMRRADGEYRWMKAMALPRFLSDRQVIGYVGCTVDITDMKEAEAALIELDRGKNEFLAMLAHELRNPLAGVRNAAQLLEAEGDESTVERARAVIERQTAHMARMVDDLLDVSRVTHGKIHLRLATVDLAAMARQAIEATAHARTERSQTLTAEIPQKALWVRGDAMRLDQILCNLLDNASKFTRHGGRIWVTVEHEGAGAAGAVSERAVIRVRDNGVGIDRATLPRIFDLFVQDARGSERSRGGGIGLGLTLARRLVELHGGTIEAFSAGNALGSEFVVRLPLAADAAPGEDAAAPQARARTQGEPRRILVVDDNRDAAEAQGLALELAGHVVRVVGDGAAAVRAMAEFAPDVVLLDIGLPDMDGYRVARDIRAMPGGAEPLIVAITGYGREDDLRKSQEAGVDEHLTKPADPAVLAELLARGRKKRSR